MMRVDISRIRPEDGLEELGAGLVLHEGRIKLAEGDAYLFWDAVDRFYKGGDRADFLELLHRRKLGTGLKASTAYDDNDDQYDKLGRYVDLKGLQMAFCATGKGGGIDPTCGKGGVAAKPGPSRIEEIEVAGDTVKVHMNPSATKLKGLLNRYEGGVRVLWDPDSNETMAWDAGLSTHQMVGDALGLGDAWRDTSDTILTDEDGEELDPDDVDWLPNMVVETEDQVTTWLAGVKEARGLNLAFCPTGDGGGIDPTCGKNGDELIAGPEQELRSYLEQTRTYKAAMPGLADFEYKGSEDLVLREGKSYSPAPLPPDVERGPAKQCYKNAAELALSRDDLSYVEGFGTVEGLPLAFAHAWCVDQAGNVVDPTWKDGSAYVGLKIDTGWLAGRLVETGTYGVLGGHTREAMGLFENGMPDGSLRLSFAGIKGLPDGIALVEMPEGLTLAFCPTGSGGGVDPTCGKDGGTAAETGRLAARTTMAAMREAGKDTLQMLSDGNGHFGPERQALHEKAFADALAKGQVTGNKEFIVMGGGTAAGKSTLLKSGSIEVQEGTVTINADDMKEYLPEYQDAAAAREKDGATMVHEESSYMAAELGRRARDAGVPVVLDSTGNSNVTKLRLKTEAMRKAGYSVHAKYVTVDPQLLPGRNKHRFETKGRWVPPEVIEHSHKSSGRTFLAAIEAGLYDTAELWESADKPTLIYKNGEVKDQAMWDAFLKRIE